jgi:hypothetical protein
MHVQHRVIVPASALRELHAAIGKCLDDDALKGKPGLIDVDSSQVVAV